MCAPILERGSKYENIISKKKYNFLECSNYKVNFPLNCDHNKIVYNNSLNAPTFKDRA